MNHPQILQIANVDGQQYSKQDLRKFSAQGVDF